jgi:hypothetical protein
MGSGASLESLNMADYKSDFARFLLDNGLIFEINRKVLTPLGLALVIDVDEENEDKVAIRGLWESEDPEGILFESETFTEGRNKYEEFLKKEGQRRLDARQKELGYIVQESP